MAYITSNDYEKVIYSGESENNRIRIWFNDVELEDADYYCEKLTVSSRILPNDASKRFSLDNFVSKELTLILHNVDLTTIVDKVKISLGTLVNGEYEDIPLGIFNIQNTPTTDKDKTTITLRDNSVLFDFNYDGRQFELTTDIVFEGSKDYYLKTNDEYQLINFPMDYTYLVDDEEITVVLSRGGDIAPPFNELVYTLKESWSKKSILQDICNKANVVCSVDNFLGEDDLLAVYDSTITARVYVSYIAEQAGAIATVNRDGELIFVYLNDMKIKRVPLSIVEKYTLGEKYKISRVVYEDAIRKFEIGEEENDTLYLNSANPYITDKSQLNDILNLVEGFEIDSLTTGKILGNPSIDSYDLIEIYDDYSEEETIIAKTLANQTFTYNGAMTTNYTTEIGTEERKENVSVTGEATFKKWAKTELDNVNAEVKITTGNLESVKSDINNNYYDKGTVNELIQNAEAGVTNTFSEAGGNNIFRNTGLWFENTGEEAENNPYEYWEGKAKLGQNDNATNKRTILCQNGTFLQEQEVPNGEYSVSFKYKKLNELVTASVKINDIEYQLEETEETEFYTGKQNTDGEYIINSLIVNSRHIKVEFISNTDNGLEIYDLMVNKGSVKLAYSQNQNETTTDTVNISKGITITSSNTNAILKANADGIRILTLNEEVVAYFTDKGLSTNELIVKNKAQTCGMLTQEVGDQTWLTRM